jgi:hypothetical protein
MLSVDLRYEQNRLVTPMLIEDKEFKEKGLGRAVRRTSYSARKEDAA